MRNWKKRHQRGSIFEKMQRLSRWLDLSDYISTFSVNHFPPSYPTSHFQPTIFHSRSTILHFSPFAVSHLQRIIVVVWHPGVSMHSNTRTSAALPGISTARLWPVVVPASNTEQTGQSACCQLDRRRDGDSWSTIHSIHRASSALTAAERSCYDDIESPLKSTWTDRHRTLPAPRSLESGRNGRGRHRRRPEAAVLSPSMSTMIRSTNAGPVPAWRQPFPLPVSWRAGRRDAWIRGVRRRWWSRRCRPSERSVAGRGSSVTHCWCPTRPPPWRRGWPSVATVTTTTSVRRLTAVDDHATWCAFAATTGECRPCHSRRNGNCTACRSYVRANVSCDLNCWRNDAHNQQTRNETVSRLQQTAHTEFRVSQQ